VVSPEHARNDERRGTLENYIGDLRYVSGVSVGFWNEMGNGTPYIDPDNLDADKQMADYIFSVEKALAELREVKS
jgi:hypothetical protein